VAGVFGQVRDLFQRFFVYIFCLPEITYQHFMGSLGFY